MPFVLPPAAGWCAESLPDGVVPEALVTDWVTVVMAILGRPPGITWEPLLLAYPVFRCAVFPLIN